ncbi:MAG TPA: phytanoyl-CoA dioxygenase family protein [Armatimonadota bacterium]|nr:phytanoyl-CoA dioxygenase family protein [Armatimonadota bacterium]
MSITDAELRTLNETGYLVKEDLIPPEWVAEIRRDLDGLHDRMAERVPEGVHVSWEHEVDASIQRRIKQLMHAELVSPALDRLVRSPEVLDVVEGVLGPDIAFFHCKLLMKAARDGTVTPWHQDYSYWVTSDNRPLMLNCMLQIDDSTLENGCLQMVPGSHLKGLVEHDRNAQPFGRFLPGYFQPREDAVPVPLRAGSAIFFGPLVIHGSDANRSGGDRRAVTIAYNVTGNGMQATREVLRGQGAELAGSAGQR